MLDADIDPLFDVSISNSFVYDYPDRGFGDVVDYPGLPMVDFVGHAI